MYYVIQVAPREEQKIVNLIKGGVPKEIYSECFFPMRDIRRKIRGEFMDFREKLFPGYVFVESEKTQELYENLKAIPHLTKMLGVDFDDNNQALEFIELPANEIAWLTQIMSDDDKNIVPLSQITIDARGNIKILSGALKYLAACVVKFDLHKRIAKVQVKFKGKPIVLHLGIEIIKGREVFLKKKLEY